MAICPATVNRLNVHQEIKQNKKNEQFKSGGNNNHGNNNACSDQENIARNVNFIV